MSEHESDRDDQPDTSDAPGTSNGDTEGIPDDQLPPDLQPSEDNPLARHPDQTGDESDRIGADTEGEPETAPLTEEDGPYSHEGDDAG